MLVLGGRDLYARLDEQLSSLSYISTHDLCSSSLEIEAEQVVLLASHQLMKERYEVGGIDPTQFMSNISKIRCKRLFFLSSASVYGLSVERNVSFRETDLINPGSSYAHEKVAVEGLLREMQIPELVMLRSSGFYGGWPRSGPKNILDSWVRDAVGGFSKGYDIQHAGRQVRDFAFVPDLIALIHRWSTSSESNRQATLNFSSTGAVMMLDIINEMGSVITDGLVYELAGDKCIHSSLNCELINHEFPGTIISRNIVAHLAKIISARGSVS